MRYSVKLGTGNPSPKENLPKIFGLQRADIESTPTGFGKITEQNNYALRIN